LFFRLIEKNYEYLCPTIGDVTNVPHGVVHNVAPGCLAAAWLAGWGGGVAGRWRQRQLGGRRAAAWLDAAAAWGAGSRSGAAEEEKRSGDREEGEEGRPIEKGRERREG
jgi:hypothetical protein